MKEPAIPLQDFVLAIRYSLLAPTNLAMTFLSLLLAAGLG